MNLNFVFYRLLLNTLLRLHVLIDVKSTLVELIKQVISRYPNQWCTVSLTHISMVSCQKGPTRHAYAWQIGPFWQDTIDICGTEAGSVSKSYNRDSNYKIVIRCLTSTTEDIFTRVNGSSCEIVTLYAYLLQFDVHSPKGLQMIRALCQLIYHFERTTIDTLTCYYLLPTFCCKRSPLNKLR